MRPHSRRGLAAMIAAALAFGTSGVLLKPLIDAGWSPAAAVALRVALAGLVLAGPAIVALRGTVGPILRSWRLMLAYGLVAVTGTQVFYFAAIQHLPIAVALLIQYSAPVMIAVLGWVTGRVAVRTIVVLGVLLSVAGLVLVVGIDGIEGELDAMGIWLALASAVCLAGYYLLSARPTPGVPPVALVASGLLVGAGATAAVGASGLLAWEATTVDVRLGQVDVPWWVPMLLVALVATAAAYLLSIVGSRLLGSRLASFAGLTEVLFAVAIAWVLLGEQPGWKQLAGGAAILGGAVLVGQERARPAIPVDPAGLEVVGPLPSGAAHGQEAPGAAETAR